MSVRCRLADQEQVYKSPSGILMPDIAQNQFDRRPLNAGREVRMCAPPAVKRYSEDVVLGDQ